MAGADPRQTRLNELRGRLASMQEGYRKAKDQVKSDGWGQKKDLVFTRLSEAIMEFSPGDTGEKAVFLVGQCRGILLDMGEPLLTISTYEALREQALKLEGALKLEEKPRT